NRNTHTGENVFQFPPGGKPEGKSCFQLRGGNKDEHIIVLYIPCVDVGELAVHLYFASRLPLDREVTARENGVRLLVPEDGEVSSDRKACSRGSYVYIIPDVVVVDRHVSRQGFVRILQRTDPLF